MALITSKHTPYELINSSLIGIDDIVQLRHHKLIEARHDKLNDPVVAFFKNTSFLEDVKGFLACEILSDLGPIKSLKDRVDNTENIKSIRDISLVGFKSVGGKWSNFKMLFLTYDKMLCSVETSIRLTSNVKDLLNVSKENLNKFHIVVNTPVGQIQSIYEKAKS